MQEISAEELFDLLHTMGNEAEKEWHSLENNGHERAEMARDRRHKLVNYLMGENPAKPQLLCEFKHTLSVRTEHMELAEKFRKSGNKKMLEFEERAIDDLGEELINLIQKIRSEPLKINT